MRRDASSECERRSNLLAHRNPIGRSFAMSLAPWEMACFSIFPQQNKYGTRFVLSGRLALESVTSVWNAGDSSGRALLRVTPAQRFYMQKFSQSANGLRFAA